MAKAQSIASAVFFAFGTVAVGCGNNRLEAPTPTIAQGEIDACSASEVVVANVPRVPKSNFGSGIVIEDAPLFTINDRALNWRWADSDDAVLCGDSVNNCVVLQVPQAEDLQDRPLIYESAEGAEMEVGLLSATIEITLEATYGAQTSEGQTDVFITAVGPGACLIDGQLTVRGDHGQQLVRMEDGAARFDVTAGCGLYTVSLESPQLQGQAPSTTLDMSGEAPPPRLNNSDILTALAGRCTSVFDLELLDACSGEALRGWTLSLESDEFTVGTGGVCDDGSEYIVDTSATINVRADLTANGFGEVGVTAKTLGGAEVKRTFMVPIGLEDALRAVVQPTTNPVGCFPVVLEVRSGADLARPPPNTQVGLQVLNSNVSADNGLFLTDNCMGPPVTEVSVSASQTQLYLQWNMPDEVEIRSTLNTPVQSKVDIYELVLSGPDSLYGEDCAMVNVVANGRDGPIQLREPVSIETMRADSGPNQLSVTANCSGPNSFGDYQLNSVSPGDTVSLRGNGSGRYYLRATVREGQGRSQPIRVRGERCGDDIVQWPRETCDGAGGIGCNSNCQVLPSFICAGSPSLCALETTTLHVRPTCSQAIPTCLENVSEAITRAHTLGFDSTILVLGDVPFGAPVIDTNEPQVYFDIDVVASPETVIVSAGPLLAILSEGVNYSFRGGYWLVGSQTAFEVERSQLELRDLRIRGQVGSWWGVETYNNGAVQILRSQIENFGIGGLRLAGDRGAIVENVVVTGFGSPGLAMDIDVDNANHRFIGITTLGYEGGLVCQEATMLRASAIGPASSVMQSNCRFVDSVVDSAAYAAGIDQTSLRADPQINLTGELRFSSPCVDRGQRNLSYTALVDDRDRKPRPLLGDIDCGAVEFW